MTRFQDQDPIVVGDLNSNIQYQNPHSHQVDDLLMELGLVDLCHHLGSAGGSDTCNVVSYATRKVFADKV